MIGKGAQYLTAAGFGRYRITAASLGSLDLLGTFSWLKGPAVQAIMAAFGVDGTAVIAATNEYLNGIAASDKVKAQQIADWLNVYVLEDAYVVCSLVPTLGVTRWLVGDGTAWFSTGYIPVGYNHEFYTKFKLLAAGQGNKGVWGKGSYSNQIQNAVYITCWTPGGYPNLFMYGWQGKNGDWGGDTTGSKYDYEWSVLMQFSQTNVHLHIDQDGSQYRDADYTQTVNFANDNIPLYMFKGSNAGASKSAIAESYIKDNGELVHWYLPMMRNGVAGMIDVITGVFKTNEAGSGSFTIPDISYTPTP